MNSTPNIDLQSPKGSVDDELDSARLGTAATGASCNPEDGEEFPSSIMAHPRAAAATKFCSADACSVRKDVTRRARRLLLLPEPTPSEAGHDQQQRVDDLSTAAPGADGAAQGKGEVSGAGGGEMLILV